MTDRKLGNPICRIRHSVCGANSRNMDKPVAMDVKNDTEQLALESQCYEVAVDERQILDGAFSDGIEDVFEPVSSIPRTDRLIRRARRSHNRSNTVQSTSFLDLPQELRDEIYRYAVPTGNVYQIRFFHKRGSSSLFRERLPKLCFALPLLHHEIMEMHYKHDSFLLFAKGANKREDLLTWIHRRGPVMVQNIQHLKIRHRVKIEPNMYTRNCDATTTVAIAPNGNLDIRHSQQRDENICRCAIHDLVQERLSREDALNDPACIRRIEESTQYGPVLGFALQLIEAIDLAEAHEKVVLEGPEKEYKAFRNKWSRECKVCDGDKLKWFVEF